MTTTQVLILNSLRGRGWPLDLKCWLLSRCSGAEADYATLAAAGFLEVAATEDRLTGHTSRRIVLTHEGKRRLAAEKATHRHAV